jgi:hypothetical protein
MDYILLTIIISGTIFFCSYQIDIHLMEIAKHLKTIAEKK